LGGETRVDVTLRDIAKKVNRSVTTVSRALHGYADVSAETRTLVLQTAADMGYFPNTAAQRLQRRRADTVGLFLSPEEPSFSDPVFGDVLSAVAGEIAKSGFDLLVRVAADTPSILDGYQQKVSGRSIDTVLVVRTKCEDPRIRYLQEHKIPFVSNGRIAGDNSFLFVDIDYRRGMGELIRHLVSLGHERIGFVSGPLEYMFVLLQMQGFEETCMDMTIGVSDDLVVLSGLSQRGGYQGAQQLLSAMQPPTAIVASNDLMALGVMSAVQDHGLEVGRDVAVAGFDGIPMAETSHPTMTTVQQPSQHIGRLLGRLLIASAAGEQVAEPHIIVEPSLVIRQSTNIDLWL
jgi:LacI family transcriptional regulator